MHETVGDIFSPNTKVDAICITTNIQVKKNGLAVMGAGLAKQAADRWPILPIIYGKRLLANETLDSPGFDVLTDEDGESKSFVLVWDIGAGMSNTVITPYAIVALPTKLHWRDKSDIKLIQASINSLVSTSTIRGWKTVLLTRPGCGLGGLNWEKEVRPVIEPLLNDRFWIVTPK